MGILRKKYWGKTYEIAKKTALESVSKEERRDLKDMGVAEFQLSRRPFPHPETDYEDDSVGVEKKAFKTLLKALGEEDTVRLFKAVSGALRLRAVNFPKDMDGFMDWEDVFLPAVNMAEKKEGSHVFDFIKAILANRTVRVSSDSSEEGEKAADMIDWISENSPESLKESIVDDLCDVIDDPKGERLSRTTPLFEELKIAQKEVKLQEQIEALGGSQSNLSLWKKPPVVDVLAWIPPQKVVGPENRVFPHWERLFGTKQLAKMDREDKILAVLLAALPPKIQKLVEDKETLGGILTSSISSDAQENEDSIAEIVRNFGKVEGLDGVTDILPVLLEFSTEDIEFLKKIPSKAIYAVSKYKKYPIANDVLFHVMRVKKEVYDARTKGSSLPKVEGNIEGYRYTLHDKDDVWGLFAGYAVDNCQVLGGVGNPCLKTAFTHKKAGLYSVFNPKGYLVSNAFAWIKKMDGKKIVVLDSIEALGQNDGSYPSKVVDAFAEIVGKILQRKNTEVFIGRGNGIGVKVVERLEDEGYRVSSDLSLEEMRIDPIAGYTDAAQGWLVTL